MVEQPGSGSRRVLYVAHQACGNPAFCAQVRSHAIPGADVVVVASVRASSLHRWTSDDAEERALAETRLEQSITCLRKHGLSVRGRLGDADPVQAIADALHGFPADEIVICLEEPERAHWLHKGVVERAKERFHLPVTEIDVQVKQPAVVA